MWTTPRLAVLVGWVLLAAGRGALAQELPSYALDGGTPDAGPIPVPARAADGVAGVRLEVERTLRLPGARDGG